MAESLTLARPYAEAAFDLAQKATDIPAWLQALEALAVVVRQPEAGVLISSPKLTDDQKAGALAEVAGGVPDLCAKMLAVMAENGRLSVLPEVLVHFRALKNAAEAVLAADIESAFPLTDSDIQAISQLLSQKFGKPVVATVSQNPALIGGVSIQIGDQIIDASVRGKLEKLATALTH